MATERAQEKRQFGHRARLALTPAQIRLVDAQAHAVRTMWNLLHDWWTMLPKGKRTLAAADAAIRQARRDIDWLAALPAQAAQAVLKTYFQAWKNCWDGRAEAPNFKARSRTVMSLEQRAAHRKSFRKPGQETSNRLKRTYEQIASLRATAKRRASDWQHRTTTHLARTYGVIVVERLDIPNMVRSARGTIENPGKNVAQKSGLNRSISQEAWGRTVTMLTYKAARQGGTLHKVPAPGTSRRCSMCGFTTPGSRESQAVFVCKNEGCGWSDNADRNAARNVLHLYRMSHALVPAAGRAVGRRPRGVKPATAR
ncbi:RNA-guided endonuclease InsQ/TnpB family protein [Streptomyces coelicoflavus]|uniref:RNA-guided endonuclease InsQ/TnpB family protein n=1 Tax=Streptomyces coelicoflavus TaxID=285562 RepID=UPI00382D6F7D